jgi:hypothetical protein
MTKFLALNIALLRLNLSVRPVCGLVCQMALSIGMIASFAGALIGPGMAQAQSNLKSRPVDYIVAVVNSEPITNNEVQNLKLRLEKQLQPGTAAGP